VPVKAVQWGTVSRITVDLSQGTYNRLAALMDAHNASRGPRDRHLTKAGLIRGMLGTWIHQHEAQSQVDASLARAARDLTRWRA